MDEAKTHRQQQYSLILELFNAYETGHLGLKGLVESLEALTGVLEGVSDEERNLFRSTCGIMVKVYAIVNQQEPMRLNKKQQRIIASAILKLKDIVRC